MREAGGVSRREKRLRRLVARPPEADFADVRAVLEDRGWLFARQKGSHCVFTRPGEPPITVPVHNQKVKEHYLDEICRRLGLDEDVN